MTASLPIASADRALRDLQPRWPRAIPALAIGLAAPFQFQWGGILYGSEVLLAVVALWALLTRLGDTDFWVGPFTTLMGCLGITMLAYVVADLVLGTETQ